NDQLVIRNTLNQIVDTVNYFVGTNNWPAAPTGVHAYSFELDSANKDNNDGVNWKVPNNIIASSSGTILATPGIYPPPPVNPAPQITAFRQTANNRTWVRFNQMVTSASAKTVGNYVLAPTLTIDSIQLNAGGDTALIFHSALSDGLPYTLTVNNVKNFSNVSNVSNTMSLIWNQSMPNLVITEIIHSPNDVESIEVYNAGSTIVNLGGLRWTNGTGGNFPVDTLHPGRVRMFSTAPSTAKLHLKIDTAHALTAGLGSSDDILVIRNSLNQIVDSVNYFVGNNGWPGALSGVYAYSFELNAATNDNNIGTNWNIPLNTITPQPTVGVIRASSGIYPPPIVIIPNGLISFVGTRTTVNETTSEVKIIAQLNGANNQAASAQLEILSLATATNGTDYTPPASMMFQWDSAQNGNDTLTFQITNDNTSEFSEYFVVKMKNLVNAKLADSLNNHHTVFIQDEDKQALTAQKYVELEHMTSFSNGATGSNSAEIVAYDQLSKRLFIANSIGNKLDIVNFTNPSSPSLIRSISLSTYGNINSVAAKDGKIALAIENTNPQANGKVVFMDTAGTFVSSVDVGAMPDMITFNHAGTQVLTANEGEPNTTYTADPNGTVSIVDISGGISAVTNSNVSTLDFTSFDSQLATLRASGIRIFGPSATVSNNMEPEYVTVLPGDSLAQVACQENNAIVIVNLISKQIIEIRALGTKDFATGAGALDASDQGSDIHIAQWPVKGVYMPDAIANFNVGGQNYIITANEGDAREYNAYSEIKRISDATYILDSVRFPNRQELKANIGRLNITTASGDTDNDGDFDEIHTFGSRSVSIFNSTTGALVWDGGSDMEWLIAKHPTLAAIFNASNANNTRKNRSDDKGPEPEGVATAKIGNNTYAFIALERIGGCMVYDVTNPASPVFQDYKNTRNTATYAGDNGAEGIIHIPAAESPDGQDWVILANEVSSTLSIYKLKTCFTNLNKTITAAGNTEFCQGDSVRLKAASQSNVTYQWFKDNTTTGSADSSFVAKNSGNYNAIVSTVNPSCSLTSNAINVVVNPLPTVIFSLPIDSICDTIVNLNFSGALPAGGSFKLNNSVISAFSPKNSGIGNYTIVYEVTDAKGCKNSASDNIKIIVCKAVTPPPVSIQTAALDKLALYPMPVQTTLYIENGGIMTDFELFNQLGMKIIQGKVVDNKIDVSKLVDGIYHLNLTDNQGNIYTQKIVK
ncbi:MAG: choice-of-anchor I family protein, partial [Chitinophagales bacterium]